MLNKNAQAWVDALRSGDYEQGRNSLHTVEADYSRHCCLGVACDLFAIAHPEVRGWEIISNVPNSFGVHRFFLDTERHTTVLPSKVCEWLGLTHIVNRSTLSSAVDNANVMYLQNSLPNNLVALNDGGSTFAEIADIIEANQKELFNAE